MDNSYNQPIEHFGVLQVRKLLPYKYDTYEDIITEVSKYIHYYNNYRYTECLGGRSPNEYRRVA